MFDIPDAKRVRRSELSARSESPSPARSSPDLELEAQLQARLASLYGPVAPHPTALPTPGSKPPSKTSRATTRHREEDDEGSDVEAGGDDSAAQEFEFRLFAAPTRDDTALSSAPQTVVLELEEDDLGEGGFVVPRRGLGYYFATRAEGEAKKRFDAVALSGDEVLKLSAQRAWGLEVPWRVRPLRVVGRKDPAIGGDKGGPAEVVGIGEAGKRTKPGKRRRIILRERKKKTDAAEERTRRVMDLRGESERDKKTRMNREKKAKRKLREKAKKAGLGQAGTVVVVGDVEGGADHHSGDRDDPDSVAG